MFREKDIRIKLKIGLAQETDSSRCLLNNPSPAVCIFLLIKAIWMLWKEHIFFTKPIIILSCTKKKKAPCSTIPDWEAEEQILSQHISSEQYNIRKNFLLCLPVLHSCPCPCPFHPQSDGAAHFEHVKATPGEPFSTSLWTPLTQCMLTDGSS